MHTRTLGNTDIAITPLGFGSWAIGGGNWEFAWGPQDDAQAVAAIQRAIERGMNWIDTAAVYGLGHSEELVARAVAGMRPRPFIFTKCSLRWDDERKVYRSLKADSVRRECEDSLRRLKVDAIDLYQIHWPDPDADVVEGWETMARLKDEGKVRHIGVSNFSVEQMERLAPIAPVSSLQPPYSMIRRDIEREILPYCQAHNIGVIAYSPMASGLLTGAMTRARIAAFPADDWRRRSPAFQEPNVTRNLRVADVLTAIGARHGHSAGEVAIAWTLRHSAVTGAIVGGRSAEQVDGVIGAGSFTLSAGEINEIDAALAGGGTEVAEVTVPHGATEQQRRTEGCRMSSRKQAG